jgi:hypothetical protein
MHENYQVGPPGEARSNEMRRSGMTGAFRVFINVSGMDYSETALSTSTVTPGPMVELIAIRFI